MNGKKSKGQMAFTPEEIQNNRKARAIAALCDGRMFERMEVDKANNAQHFFVYTIRQIKGDWVFRFSRTAYRPNVDKGQKLLDASNPADRELIEEHFRTARYRFSGSGSRRASEFRLTKPREMKTQEIPEPVSRDKKYLRENYERLLNTKLNSRHVNYHKGQLDTSVWDEQIIAMMRSHCVNYPLPSN